MGKEGREVSILRLVKVELMCQKSNNIFRLYLLMSCFGHVIAHDGVTDERDPTTLCSLFDVCLREIQNDTCIRE